MCVQRAGHVCAEGGVCAQRAGRVCAEGGVCGAVGAGRLFSPQTLCCQLLLPSASACLPHVLLQILTKFLGNLSTP